MLLPSQLIDYTVYNSDDKAIGTGEEITLPTITSITHTASLPAGEIDLPGLRTENMELEIPFVLFDPEPTTIISVGKVTTIILRGALQKANSKTHDLEYSGIKVTCMGFSKEVELGTLKRSDAMDSKITMTITYLKVEMADGEKLVEIDKLNGTFFMNGADQRELINEYL